MALPGKGEMALIDEESQMRLNSAFHAEQGTLYLDELNRISQLPEDERIDDWKEWVDENYPGNQNEGLRNLFDPFTTYSFRIKGFLDALLSLNTIQAGISPELQVSQQQVDLDRQRSVEEIIKDNPDFVIPKDRKLRWSDEEERFIEDRILSGESRKDIYVEFVSSAITRGFLVDPTESMIKEGVRPFRRKVIRRKESFDYKFRQIDERLRIPIALSWLWGGLL